MCEFYEANQKKIAIFLVGQADEESLNSALGYLNEYAEIMNFDIAKENICVIAREAGELEIDEKIVEVVNNWF